MNSKSLCLATIAFVLFGVTMVRAQQTKLEITSVDGAEQHPNDDYYVQEALEDGSVSITITGSGDVDPPDGQPCTCNSDSTKKTEAIKDDQSNPTYTFTGNISGTTDKNKYKFDITADTDPKEYKFTLTKVVQKFKCPDSYSGGPFTQTNDTASDPVTLLVYEVDTQIVHAAPSDPDPNRTTFGVGEEVNITFLPSTVQVLFSVEDGFATLDRTANNTTVLVAREYEGTTHLGIDFAQGAYHRAEFDVVKPDGGYIATQTGNEHPLYVAMLVAVQLTPTDVNFYNVQTVERAAAPQGMWGFFTPPGVAPAHPAQGEDPLDLNNSYKDQCIMSVRPGFTYSPGGFYWQIPTDWDLIRDQVHSTLFWGGNTQVMTMTDSSGNLQISKFGVSQPDF